MHIRRASLFQPAKFCELLSQRGRQGLVASQGHGMLASPFLPVALSVVDGRLLVVAGHCLICVIGDSLFENTQISDSYQAVSTLDVVV